MISNLKLEANRANAQKSTGPKTAAGKQAVSQNALTHGLRSRHVVLLMESRPEFQQLYAAFRDEWQPATPTQEDLVEQLAVNKWKLARYEAAETQACMQSSLIHMALRDPMEFQTDHGTIKFPAVDTKQELAAERSLARIGQHIARIERAYFRALQTLRSLQGARPQQLPRPQRSVPPAPPEQPEPKVMTAGTSAVSPEKLAG